MKVQILTPENVIFDAEVESVLVPGKLGEFQILKNHAPIISTLQKGKIMVFTEKKTNEFAKLQEEIEDKKYSFAIEGGVIEFSNNTAIILCD